MRAGATRRGARAVIALLVGLLVGGWVGGGLVYVFNRHKLRDPSAVSEPALVRADEVDLVPADAAGFVHVRLAGLWKTDAMAEFRKVVDKAGPDVLKALDEAFVPAPSTVDRVTLVVTSLEPAPQVYALVAFNEPYDAERFREANMPGAASRKSGAGKEYWIDVVHGYAAHFPNDRLVVVGMPSAVEGFLNRPANTAGPLTPALKLAAEGRRHMVTAVNLTRVQKPVSDLRRELSVEFDPLLKADMMAVGVVVGGGVRLDLRATYKDEKAAEEAERAARAAAEYGRKQLAEPRKKMEEAVRGKPGGPKTRPVDELPGAVAAVFGLGAINMLDEWLADPNLVRRDGTELSAVVTMPSLAETSMRANALTIGLLLPAVQKVREAAGRATANNNLKQLAFAMHTYNDAHGRLPAAAGLGSPNAPGTGNLSWRVHLLPFIEQEPLYRQFKLDEPWDSPHNKALIDKMPKVYENPRAPAGPGRTYCKVFVRTGGGPGPIFDPKVGRPLQTIQDGTSNTILILEGGAPVTWTQPVDIPYNPKAPLPDLTLAGDPVVSVALADGSVRTLNVRTVPEPTLRALITADGAEVIGNW